MKKTKNKKFRYKNSNFGIGIKKKILLRKIFGLNIRKKPRKLKIRQKNQLQKIINKSIIGKELKLNIKKIINFYIELKSYKGMRHKYKYPIRGQRTRTNAKTVKKTA
jgi:small subunit ribosomal protein S13